jgi:TRAP-type C4-dicarboxylate transport system permease small subunit
MTHEPTAPISVEEMAHAFEDEEAHDVDLSIYAVEDWLVLALFWGMALCVFLQFFTRYALNNSLAWTEEIAANLLVVIVFVGAAMCVRLARHIAVDLLYRFLSHPVGRVLQVIVDLICIGFFAYMSWLLWRYIGVVGSERMVTVDLPRGIVFYSVFGGFLLMTLRALQNFVRDLRERRTVREQGEDLGPTGV